MNIIITFSTILLNIIQKVKTRNSIIITNILLITNMLLLILLITNMLLLILLITNILLIILKYL